MANNSQELCGGQKAGRQRNRAYKGRGQRAQRMSGTRRALYQRVVCCRHVALLQLFMQHQHQRHLFRS